MFLRLIALFVFAVVCLIPLPGAGEEEKDFLGPGMALYEQGKYEQAYHYFFELFLQEPQNKTINSHLGQAAYAMGDYEAAVMAFERVLIIDPAAAAMKLELAKAYTRLGSTEIAAEYIDELLQAGTPDAICSQARQLLDEIHPAEMKE